MNWVKRKGTTGKYEWPQQFLLEEKLTFLKKISGAIFYHDVPKELFYLSPGKQTFDVKDVKTVPIKGIDHKRLITATFSISMSGEILPIQVIYESKTIRCLSKYAFSKNLDVTFFENHRSNTENAIIFLKYVFSQFNNARQTKGYPNEQMSLVILDTFKGQDNEEVAKLCRENHSVLISVPPNLTNKLQTLDITFNKPAKSFIK